MLSTMVAFAESQYTVTNEVAIYEKLLTFEQSRTSKPPTRVRNKHFVSIVERTPIKSDQFREV